MAKLVRRKNMLNMFGFLVFRKIYDDLIFLVI